MDLVIFEGTEGPAGAACETWSSLPSEDDEDQQQLVILLLGPRDSYTSGYTSIGGQGFFHLWLYFYWGLGTPPLRVMLLLGARDSST